MYGIMMAAGVLSAVLLFKFICKKKKVANATYDFYAFLAVVSIALGIGGAFLFQIIYRWIASGFKTFELSGMTFMGGLVTGVTVFVAGTALFAKGQVKRDFWTVANYAAPCLVLGHAFGRFGCFFAGCCYGLPTDGPFGIVFPDLVGWGDYAATGGRAYPTQLFEAVFLLVLFAVMTVLLFRFDKGPFLLVYGYAYAVFRFSVEFIRGDERWAFLPGLTPSQFQSIVLLLAATALTVLIYYFHIVPFARAKDPLPAPAAADEAATGRPTDDAQPLQDTAVPPDRDAPLQNTAAPTEDAPTVLDDEAPAQDDPSTLVP